MKSTLQIVGVVALSLLVVGCKSSKSKKVARFDRLNSATGSSTSANGTASLGAPRAEHTASALSATEILITGGVDAAGAPLSSSLLIDAAGVTRGPELETGRVGHTATALPSGKVLVAGGWEDTARTVASRTTEVFDPLTGLFSPGPTLRTVRAGHVAAAIPGTEWVLVAGGYDAQGRLLASGEIVDLRNGGAPRPCASAVATPRAAWSTSARSTASRTATSARAHSCRLA